MVDLHAVEIELQNARQARIRAELACCDIEELTEEIRRSHHAFMRRDQRRATSACIDVTQASIGVGLSWLGSVPATTTMVS
jgi:hypothetical protein